MINSNENIKKICSLYVSDWHLITMIIPYLKEKLDKNIETCLEKNLDENINILMDKLVLNSEDKNKIKSINWREDNTLVEEKLKEKIQNADILIVAGCHNYIKIVNKYVNNYAKNGFTVINCFEVTGRKENVKEIFAKHQYLLNTSGEKHIEDIFEMYVS